MVKIRVAGYKIISKPRRMFYFFQPSEAIQGSRFDLIIHFENVENKFHGGSFLLKFRQPGNIIQDYGRVEIPPIEQEGRSFIIIENQILLSSGACGIYFYNQHYNDIEGKPIEGSYIVDPSGSVLGNIGWIPFIVSSREELYQKYSVIVAIWASILSIVISTISILISLFW